ncbi:hypothetical protein [Nannocystis pusilla]|uniref:hypothetical protein n=1 Tax=Nannocystis pusilla TaxID=889268 RepID=UPI003DA5C3AD
MKTGDPERGAALTVTHRWVAMQRCDDLAKTLHEQMFGDGSDERMAEDVPCMGRIGGRRCWRSPAGSDILGA